MEVKDWENLVLNTEVGSHCFVTLIDNNDISRGYAQIRRAEHFGYNICFTRLYGNKFYFEKIEDVRNNISIGENNMVIEFDFEIYKNGDYDKVYLRNGKEARVLCDNGKGNSPMVVMIEDDKADDYIILRYNETGRRNINGQSGLDLMLSVKEWEPELWVVVISYMDNKDKRQKMVLPNFFSKNIRGNIYLQGSSKSSVSYYVGRLEGDGCFDELCEKIRVKRDRIYNMEIISLSDDKATV
jgi:hypothetical protein